MEPREEKPPIEGLELYSLVGRLRGEGLSGAELLARLVDRGVGRADAEGLLSRISAREAREDLRDKASFLLSEGQSVETTRKQLSAAGFALEEIDVVLAMAVKEQSEESGGGDAKRIWRWLGAALFLLGLCLIFGNISG